MLTDVEQKKTVQIGDYVLTGKIGEGGIAKIYKARQESLDRDVAIKILSSRLTEDPEIVMRFEQESLVIAKLNHPNIVHIIDRGIAGGRYYFVMEFVDGTSLRQVIDSDRIPLGAKLDMVVQVCKGLDYAHKNGVIHRDIKPANVLIDLQGNALVADFGIAQILGKPKAEMTSSDMVMGTTAYMSPEQRISSTNVDQTTDIYAMGIVLYEILVGQKPMGHFKLPSELNERIDPAFDRIVLKCLAQDRADRFQTAVELKDAILELTGGKSGETDKEPSSMESAATFLGKCRHLDTIRETDFGSTILVENGETKKLYVIKKHNKRDHGRKEARLLSALSHENIIQIYGAGGDKRSSVIVSAYAQGGSLADRMARPYKWPQAFEIICQVASGLDFAHKNNVVHGNLRPSNILFDADEVVKLCDFGMPLHYSGKRMKNWYSAPERKASRHGDMYSLGVILHQTIFGRIPIYDSANNLIMDGSTAAVPEDVIGVIRKLISIRVSQRYQSAEEFLADWREVEASLMQTKSPLPQKMITKENQAEKRFPAWAWIIVGLVFLAALYGGLYLSDALG